MQLDQDEGKDDQGDQAEIATAVDDQEDAPGEDDEAEEKADQDGPPQQTSAQAESSDEEPLATATAGTPATTNLNDSQQDATASHNGSSSRKAPGKHGMKGTSAKGAGLARTAISHANAHPTQSSKKPSARSVESVMGRGSGSSSSDPSKAAAAQADLAQKHADEEQEAEANMLKQQQQHQAKLDSKAVQSITAGLTVDADDITGQVRGHFLRWDELAFPDRC